MKKNNRGKLYKLCTEYSKLLDIRSELYITFPSDSPVIENINMRIEEKEEKMLRTLLEE